MDDRVDGWDGCSLAEPVAWKRYKGQWCAFQSGAYGLPGNLKEFVAASKNNSDLESALGLCESFCASNSICWGCSVQEVNPQIIRLNAVRSCGYLKNWPGRIEGDVSEKLGNAWKTGLYTHTHPSQPSSMVQPSRGLRLTRGNSSAQSTSTPSGSPPIFETQPHLVFKCLNPSKLKRAMQFRQNRALEGRCIWLCTM